MAYTENVANFIDALGPFYEYVDVPGKKKLNNNTAKGPPSSGDASDSCNEGTESGSSGGRNTPITNGTVLCDAQGHHNHLQSYDDPVRFYAQAVPMDVPDVGSGTAVSICPKCMNCGMCCAFRGAIVLLQHVT